MDVNLFDFIKFCVRVVYPVGSGENAQTLSREFRGGDGGAVSSRENDFRGDYRTTAEKTRLFCTQTDLKRKVCYIRQIAIDDFSTLTLIFVRIVGKLRVD